MTNTIKKKRYYKLGEKVWSKDLNTKGIVKNIDIENKKMTIEVLNKHDDNTGNVFTGDLWQFNKDKDSLAPRIQFAKFTPTAILPHKGNLEDAGYDVWLDEAFLGDESTKLLKKHQVHQLPTGIGVAVDKEYWCDFAHERGSTGSIGMQLLSGVVDSGYRGEVFLNICPLEKDILLSKEATKVIIQEDVIIYPIKKAVAQMVLQKNLQANVFELSLEDFQKLPSVRGTKKLGSTDNV